MKQENISEGTLRPDAKAVKQKKAPRGSRPPTRILRDVAPDRVPVEIYDTDGSLWNILDLDVRMAAAVEKIARKEGIDFRDLITVMLVRGFEKRREQQEGGAQ